MIMTNKVFYEFTLRLEQLESYRNCIPITDRKADEQFRMELVLRLMVAEYIDWNSIAQYTDFSELLDKETLKLCTMAVDYEQFLKQFNETFNLLYEVLGEDSFKKYNGEKSLGPFLTSAFQGIATGVFKNISEIIVSEDRNDWLKSKIQGFYSEGLFLKNTVPGAKAIPRYKELSIFGAEYFKP